MLDFLYDSIGHTAPGSVIISIALMLFLGFAMTRLTKKVHLPNVTAYILTGILIGPYCLDLIPQEVIDGTDFLPDVALAFIAFSVGEYFRVDVLKKNGLKVVAITLFEACLASLLVFAVTYWWLGLPLAFSITLSALASATAPASTIMTIRQTGAKGDLVDTLLQVVALDDVVGLVAYSIAISIALSSLAGGAVDVGQLILRPIVVNIGVVVLGGGFGVLLKLFMFRRRSSDNRLIIAISLLFGFCGICSMLDVSPLLGCMSMGMVYINITGDEKLFMQLGYFNPPILLLFFVRSGLSFRLDTLLSATNAINGVPLLAVGVIYFFVRIVGKYAGAYLGCLVTGKDKKVRNYLGLGLIPQAGVAIGLAAMCARLLGNEIGEDLQTIILASSVLYEMIGPACAKLSLYLSGSYSTKLEDLTQVSEHTESGEKRAPVDVLIERIAQIHAEQVKERSLAPPEEDAFTQAAQEQRWAELETRPHRGRFINR